MGIYNSIYIQNKCWVQWHFWNGEGYTLHMNECEHFWQNNTGHQFFTSVNKSAFLRGASRVGRKMLKLNRNKFNERQFTYL